MLRILVVDDDHRNLKMMQQLLKAPTAPLVDECITAENGLEAIKTMREKAVDLVFLDVEMPVMNGVEAAKQINDLFPDVYSNIKKRKPKAKKKRKN